MTVKAQRRPRLMSLSEVADTLGMKRPNVAKFLARRGVEPFADKAQGYFWDADVIAAVKAEREADEARMAADRRRSESARRGRPASAEPPPPELARLGPSQRRLLGDLLRRPIRPEVEGDRYALRRLRERGLVATLDGTPGTWTLTANGRRIAGQL